MMDVERERTHKFIFNYKYNLKDHIKLFWNFFLALNTTSLLDLLSEQMSLKVILVFEYTERGT